MNTDPNTWDKRVAERVAHNAKYMITRYDEAIAKATEIGESGADRQVRLPPQEQFQEYLYYVWGHWTHPFDNSDGPGVSEWLDPASAIAEFRRCKTMIESVLASATGRVADIETEDDASAARRKSNFKKSMEALDELARFDAKQDVARRKLMTKLGLTHEAEQQHRDIENPNDAFQAEVARQNRRNPRMACIS